MTTVAREQVRFAEGARNHPGTQWNDSGVRMLGSNGGRSGRLRGCRASLSMRVQIASSGHLQTSGDWVTVCTALHAVEYGPAPEDHVDDFDRLPYPVRDFGTQFIDGRSANLFRKSDEMAIRLRG